MKLGSLKPQWWALKVWDRGLKSFETESFIQDYPALQICSKGPSKAIKHSCTYHKLPGTMFYVGCVLIYSV